MLCPCLARVNAGMRLDRYNTSDELENAVIGSLTAFEIFLLDNYEDLECECGELISESYWILDYDGSGSFYLQIIGFEDNYAVQRLCLMHDGESVSVYQKTKILDNLEISVCVKRCSEEQIDNAKARYSLLNHAVNAFFWRLSALETGEYVLVSFAVNSADESQIICSAYYPWAFLSEEISTSDLGEVNTIVLSNDLSAVLNMDFSELEFGQDLVLLHDFLRVSLTDDHELAKWNLPAAASERYEEFFYIRNAVRTFLLELEEDAELKGLFVKMSQWKFKHLGGMNYSLSGTDQNGKEIEAVIYPAGVDVNGWVTPSRKRLQELSRSGENSALIVDDVKNKFVEYALTDLMFGMEMAGKHGSAKWIWSYEDDGSIRLEVHSIDTEKARFNENYEFDRIIFALVDDRVVALDYIAG